MSIVFLDTWPNLQFGLTAISKWHEQLCFDPAEATTKQLENQSNQWCMADEMQSLDKMLWQVSPFAESYKQMH
jgi:hypothetical protein